VKLLQRIARMLTVLLALGLVTGSIAPSQWAYAQTAGSAQPAAPANAAPPGQAAPNADPHIDKAQIAQRLNRELDFNLEIITSGCLFPAWMANWRARVFRYTELNRLRDELQRIRSDVAEAWGKIQPRLDADRASLARTRGLAVLPDHAVSLALKHGDPARRAIERHYRHVLLKSRLVTAT
jgi:hypothetical protein